MNDRSCRCCFCVDFERILVHWQITKLREKTGCPWRAAERLSLKARIRPLIACRTADWLFVLLRRLCEKWFSKFSQGVLEQEWDNPLRQPNSITSQSSAICAQARRQLFAWPSCTCNGSWGNIYCR